MKYSQFLLFILLSVDYIFADRSGTQSNRLTFSPTAATGISLIALLSTEEFPQRLLAYIEQEDGDGWLLVTSEDALTWREEACDLMPKAGKGDIINFKLIPGFKYLVVYETNYDDDEAEVVIGVVTDEFLRGHKELLRVRGTSPFLFELDGSLYLGRTYLDPGSFVQIGSSFSRVPGIPYFHKLNLNPDGSLYLTRMNSRVFYNIGHEMISPRVFCFNKKSTDCLLMYDVKELSDQSRTVYVPGTFQVIANRLAFFRNYINKDPLYFDHGVSTSSFKIVGFRGQFLVVGWSVAGLLDLLPTSYIRGLTLARIIEYTPSGLLQYPIDLSKYESQTLSLSISDIDIGRNILNRILAADKSHMLDLHFDDGNNLQDAQFAIYFTTTDGSTGSLILYPYADKLTRTLILNFTMAQGNCYACSAVWDMGKSEFKGAIKIIIDNATVLVFLEDGKYVLTQPYSFNGSGQITKVALRSLGHGSLKLLKYSSVTSLNSIHS